MAPVNTASGYGQRSRDIAWALLENDLYDVTILPTPWGGTPQNFLQESNPDHLKILNKFAQPNVQLAQPDIWIQITVPNEFQKNGLQKSIGITAGIETTLADPSWIEGCNKMDLVLCSSKHSMNVLKNTKYDIADKQTMAKVNELSLTKEIDVLFEGINFNIYKKTDDINKNINSFMNQINNNFLFLVCGHWLPGQIWEDRKNIGGTIYTFLDTFKNKKTAPALLLKISCGTYSEIDRNEILKRINQIKKSFNSTVRLPDIYLLHGELSDDEMNFLYNHAKVKTMISLTKGEGFGRPLAEFAVTVKPIIVSWYSGHTDFLPQEMVSYIPGELRNVHPSAVVPNMILPESQWFMANPQFASKVMIDIYENYKINIEKSRKLTKHLKDNFSYEKMKQDLYKFIDSPVQGMPEVKKFVLPTLKKVQ